MSAAGWTPPGPLPEDAQQEKPAKLSRRLILTPASEIEPEPVVWAWEEDGDMGRIPAGSLGLAAGREGTGKSSFLIWLAAKITRGDLPGSFHGEPRSVIYVAVEDSWKFTIVPRLMAAGADLTRVYRAEVKTAEDEVISLSLPTDNKALEETINNYKVALVALDPLMSAISDTLDTHVNRQVRQALDPLARIADRTGTVIAGIAHFNKSSSTDASSLITASGAFKDVARFIFAFATDDADGTSVITQTKNSLGRSDLPSLAYEVISATVATKKGDANVGRFVLRGESDRTVRDILGAHGDAEEREDKTRAQDFLPDALAEGPRRSKEVEEEASIKGISKRSLERARGKLRIVARQKPTGVPKHKGAPPTNEWWICLPQHEGDLESIGQTATSGEGSAGENAVTSADSQAANGSLTAAVWRSGGLPPQVDAEPQTAKVDRQAATQNAVTSPDRQTARPPLSQRAGGLPAGAVRQLVLDGSGHVVAPADATEETS